MEALAPALETDVRAAQRGDLDAFTRLIDGCRNVVCAITLAIVRDVSSSEDVAQEVFVAAWGNLEKLRSPSSFVPWLRQLARNHAHEFLRTRVRYGRRFAAWDDDASAIVDPKPDASDALIDREDRRALADALEELPDEAREIVTLYYREGNSARQVGELLGLSEVAVKKRLERARDAMRKALLERAGEMLRKTAPGAGFTAAVVGALALAAPTTAAAATAATAGAAKSIGWATPLAKLVSVVAGASVGAASAFGAVLYGGAVLRRRARDAKERADLNWFIATNSAVVVVVGGAWSLFGARMGTTLGLVTWAIFASAISLSYAVWLPRIVARRLAAERLEDPNAARRQRRDRIRGIVGLVIGIVSGLAGVLYSLSHP